MLYVKKKESHFPNLACKRLSINDSDSVSSKMNPNNRPRSSVRIRCVTKRSRLPGGSKCSFISKQNCAPRTYCTSLQHAPQSANSDWVVPSNSLLAHFMSSAGTRQHGQCRREKPPSNIPRQGEASKRFRRACARH